MMNLLEDVRYSIRALRKSAGFTVAAVAALALSIGANTSIFSVVRAVLLQPLHMNRPDQLVNIWEVTRTNDHRPFNLPAFLDVRNRNRSLDAISAYCAWNANLISGGEAQRLIGLRISANYFQLLGVQAEIGRTLLDDDDTPGRPKVVVLTYAAWQNHFGSDTSIVGKVISLNGESYTVTGVLPREFTFSYNTAEFAIPLAPDSDPLRNDRQSISFLRLVGRMKTGFTAAQTKADLDSVAAKLRQEYPRDMAQLTGINVLSFSGELVGSSRTILWLLMGAVGLVLLITCANLASLMIAKSSARENEQAIRSALGASPARLARQSLVESLLLSTAGGAAGLLVAGWGIAALLWLSPSDLPRSQEIRIDAGAFLWTLAISTLAGVFFGAFPAFQVLRRDLNEGLRASSRSSTGNLKAASVRSALVIAEVGISLTLLVGTGLLLKSFSRVADVNPGFRTKQVLAVSLALPATRYTTVNSITAFHDRLKQRLERMPGVISVGSVSMLPMTGLRASTPFTVAGHPPASPLDTPNAQYRVIGPGYFRSMGIPILRGRDFSVTDTVGTKPVIVISDSVARKYLAGQEPVGAHLMINDSDAPRDVEIVGVAADIHAFGLEEPVTPTNYIPLTQMRQAFVPFVTNNSFWILNSPLDSRALAGQVRRELRDLDGDVAVAGAGPIENYMQQAMSGRKFTLQIMSLFALAAILLAAAGLYGVISHSTALRTREIGVRMALGAQSSDVVRLVVTKGVALALAGVVAGSVGAAALSRLIRGMLFDVFPGDPLIFAIGAAILIATAGLASYVPARRATRVDPLTALHGD